MFIKMYLLCCIQCHDVGVMCVVIAVCIVVHAVFIFACYVGCGAFLDTTPYWVGCIAVLCVCGNYLVIGVQCPTSL
jgi:hypothetical protein